MSAVRRNRQTTYAHNWQQEHSTPTHHPPPRPVQNVSINMPPKPAPAQALVDKTDPILLAMSDEEFKRVMDEEVGIGRPTAHEERANELRNEYMLPKPKTKEEEQAMFARVMDNLRKRVIALEKEEDPDFDPDGPPNDDREGYVDDPLMRLTSGIGGRPTLVDSALQLPRKL